MAKKNPLGFQDTKELIKHYLESKVSDRWKNDLLASYAYQLGYATSIIEELLQNNGDYVEKMLVELEAINA